MRGLAIVGCTIGGAIVGSVAGVIYSEMTGGSGDFDIGPAIFGPLGGCIGACIGTIVGVLFFA